MAPKPISMNLYGKPGTIEDFRRAGNFLELLLLLTFGEGSNKHCLNNLIRPEEKPWSKLRNKSDLKKLINILVSTFAVSVKEYEDGCLVATILDGTPAFLTFVKALGNIPTEMSAQEIDDYFNSPSYPYK
ncbi:hypothetical protein G3N56_19650 [Desulfovibrio sulfodismutans]|uniref:Uncharacterized protein n=1 Tax=Desulfolutivibrio sulfodismutans TaxID=63561 RepID=A0A7K3NS63_9BACT|nr:hypothetical protein [Desulfolutivibrio sulfodismutans]NDY58957.1 hypothetical protein [Desulfolutivibrio sulfodismutans]QLA12925.1 hypothetical protein GD606_11895 [Desulfolutivibrio sulfodismutans DSM 3696]